METKNREVKLRKILDTLLDSNITFSESQKMYKEWAGTHDDSYDELHEATTYTGPTKLSAKLAELFPKQKQVRVLDIGAGTGLSGETMSKTGFTNLHALEPVKEFAVIAENKNIYQKVFNCCIGMDSTLNIPNGAYDAVVACGCFGPGCIPCDALHEVLRFLKPGGYFINCMRKEYLWTVKEYKDRLEPLTKQLEQDGKWRVITWETYANHSFEKEGLLIVCQAC